MRKSKHQHNCCYIAVPHNRGTAIFIPFSWC
nr:MAG TPA: hypothetical protein [Caudoviricetes sp.]